MPDFKDITLDPIESAEIMGMIGFNQEQLDDPVSFQKVRDIIEFFKGRPDKGYIINKLIAGKPGLDKVSHIWEYSTKRKEYETLKKQIKVKEEELSVFEK